MRRAVHAVLGMLLADATPCRRSTLPQLQSGIMARTRASPAITLLALTTGSARLQARLAWLLLCPCSMCVFHDTVLAVSIAAQHLHHLVHALLY